MRSLRRCDRWLLALIAPLWVLSLLLSALSLDRNAVVSPLRAHGAADAASYPVVARLPPWTLRTQEDDVRVGDVLLRVGGEDVRGASAARVVALAWTRMQDRRGEGVLALEVERGGERRAATGRIPATIDKRPALLVSLVFGGLAVFALLRFPQLRVAQLSFPALMATALWLGSHFDGTPQEALAAFGLRAGALLFAVPLSVRLVRHFPDGREDGARWARGWPALLGLNGLVLVDATLGGWLPGGVHAVAGKAFTLAGAALLLAVGASRYRSTTRTGRRRFKWLLLGLVVGTLPGATVAFASAFRPELGALFLPSQLAQLAVPVALVVAIARHRLFDIDRWLNVSVVVLVGCALLVGVGLVAGPGLRDALVLRSGASPRTASLLLLALALAVAVAAGRSVLGRLDAWTRRERREREAGTRDLLEHLSGAAKLRELGDVLTRSLPALWNARGAALLAEVDGGFAVVARTGALPSGLEGRSLAETAARLGGGSGVVRGEALPGRGGADAAGAPELAGHLLAAVPGPPGSPLPAAVIVVGPDRSGEAFEPDDCWRLARVAERTAAGLAALEQRSRLAEARELQEEIARERERAQQESREKSRMLATASHDLRQPLQALRLFLDALAARLPDADDRALVDKARASAVVMQQGFESLLDEARIEAGRLEPRLDAVELADLFDELGSFLAPLASARGIGLELAPTRLAVRSDRDLLRSVLQNLVANALRYSDEGTVRVRAQDEGDRVAIRVADQGRGMAAGEQARLFEPWQRGASHDDAGGGAGLGLSIVRRLAGVLGHELHVRSAPGQGSTFTLRAQRARWETSAPVPEPTSAASSLAGARIWVIDDDPSAREALVELLASWGAEARGAAGAGELLARRPAAPPDAVLVDYALGAGTGLDALSALEGHCGAVPAAVLTGERGAHVAQAVRARGLPLLHKPAAPVQLRALVTSLVGSARRR